MTRSVSRRDLLQTLVWAPAGCVALRAAAAAAPAARARVPPSRSMAPTPKAPVALALVRPGGGWPESAPAADSPPANRLSVQDPAAVAVGYIEDASRVERKKNPGFAPGNDCNSCVQLQGQKGDYGPCALFPGKVVNVHGWCTAWAPQI